MMRQQTDRSSIFRKISQIINRNDGIDNLKELEKSMYQIGKKQNVKKINEMKIIFQTFEARKLQRIRTQKNLKRINERICNHNSSLISIPNAGRDSQGIQFNLKDVKSNKGSDKGRSRNTSKIQAQLDSDIELPNTSSNPFTQQTNVDIPPAINLGGTTQQIQNNLAQGQGLNPLQSYKQFVKHKILINNKVQTTNLYEAFAFQIFKLLQASEEGRQILIKVKDALYRRRFDIYLIQSQWNLIRVHGGDDISDRQIKRLILDYMIKIFQGESSIQLIEQYYVLTSILVLSVRQYVRINIGTQNGATFQQAFEQKNIDVVYEFFAKTFGLTLTSKGNTYIFEFQNQRLVIENKKNKYFSWIQ